MTDNIGSLASLARQQLQQQKRLVFIPVYSDFGEILHYFSSQNLGNFERQTPNQKTYLAKSRTLINHLETAVQRMSRLEVDQPQQQQQQQTPQTLSRPDWIFDLIYDSLIEPNTTEFPGPMCVPLTRSNLPSVKNPEAKYLICEKSDGLRSIMVSVSMPYLPKWTLLSSNNNNNDENTDTGSTLSENQHQNVFSLRDTAVLEAAFAKLLLDGNGSASSLSSASASASASHPSMALQPLQQTQLKSARNIIKLSAIGAAAGEIKLHESRDDLFWFVDEHGLRKRLLQRSDPTTKTNSATHHRHATFFIDRSLNCAYLLVDDVPLPDLSLVIADGELLLPSSAASSQQPQQQLIFTTFDLFHIVTSDGIPTILKTESMSTRYQLLGEKFINPLVQKQLQNLNKENEQDSLSSSSTSLNSTTTNNNNIIKKRPSAIKFVRKEMFTVEQLPKLISRLSKQQHHESSSTTVVMFDGVTPNDGLIFTPDRFDLTPGSRMDQFKWKWPDCLSVDWVIKPVRQQPEFVPIFFDPESGKELSVEESWGVKNCDDGTNSSNVGSNKPILCEMFWYFKRRAQKHRKDQHDVFGHAYAGVGWFYNPHGFEITPQYLRPGSSSTNQNPKMNNNNNTNKHQQQFKDVAAEGGTVVECSLMNCDPSFIEGKTLGMWKIERARPDKTVANAITSVLSVAESISENIDIFELVGELCRSGKGRVNADDDDFFFKSIIHSSFFTSDINNNQQKHLVVKNSSAYQTRRFQNYIANAAQQTTTMTTTTEDSSAADSVLDSLIVDEDEYIRHQLKEAARKFSSCFFLIRVVPEAHYKLLRLQWRVDLGTQTKLTCNHVDASACYAFYGGDGKNNHKKTHENDDDTNNDENQRQKQQQLKTKACDIMSGSKLEGVLTLALANDGGSVGWSETCVRANFDPQNGQWCIQEISPGERQDRNHAYGYNVLNHLLFTIACRRQEHQQRINQKATRTLSSSSSSSSSSSPLLPPTPLTHPTVPIKDTHLADHTNLHYDSVTNLMRFQTSTLANNNNNNSASAAALTTAAITRGTERSSIRLHNNWIKQVLLARAIEACELGHTAEGAQVKAALLDLCCGRGGDLHKYKHSPIKYLMMIDASFESAAEAARRYCGEAGLSTRTADTARQVREKGIPATFGVADCFNDQFIGEIVADAVERNPVALVPSTTTIATDVATDASVNSTDKKNTNTHVFDLVSCQFSFHYSCSRESRLRSFLRAVSTSLRTGGIFFGTTVDDRVLKERREKQRATNSGLEKFGNECYSVEFLSSEETIKQSGDDVLISGREELLTEGYLMHMDECVQGAMEYVVPFDTRFTEIALEEGLLPIDDANFRDFFEANRNSGAGRAAFGHVKKSGSRRDRGTNNKSTSGQHQDQDQEDSSVADSISGTNQLSQIFNMSASEKEAVWLYRVVMLRKL